MKYAKSNNYYKLSKIKRYLRLFDKRIKKLQDDFKPSICPECGSECTEIDYDDREYHCDSWIYCQTCRNCYEDDEYMDKYSELESFNYFDSIAMEVWSRNFIPGKGYEWFKKCDTEMDKMIKELSSSFKEIRR